MKGGAVYGLSQAPGGDLHEGIFQEDPVLIWPLLSLFSFAER
jgi:hypothetical protein